MDRNEREPLGAYLRREREAREIKLSSVAKATKIKLPLLAALESDDHDAFPDRKGIPDYLKSYCRYLLMDEQEALKRFELQPPRHLPEVTETALPDVMELSPPDVIEDHLPPPVTRTAYVLTPSIISPAGENGIFRRYRLVFITLGAFTILFAVFSGLLFYFHPLRDMAAKTEAMKEAVPRPAVKSPAPAVRKGKVIGNRDSKRYHLPGMQYYHQVEAYHRVEFDSEAAAIRAGYHKAPR